ncbi:hypothetical protein EDB92DRAFT_2117462 [Lactarius akahatsu]|uniref:F-box domain-containing protein n=1 Tax=Lactarius akahatsu TaxID=416441 RepID=A0AAD4LA26_9AGAM|nr:hypothetical protein EDB92DRAFT_2117462 [Lactarius akahatsu]
MSDQLGGARSLYNRLVWHLGGTYLSRVVTTTKTIIHRIYHKGRNALPVRALISLHDKPRQKMGRELHAGAQTLPDDVLLEIFGNSRLASPKSSPWKWHRLAQVCRRWRFVVFAYSHLLDLRIVSTYNKPIWEAPDFWPTLPVIIWCPRSELHLYLSAKDEDSVFDILTNPAEKCTSFKLREEPPKYLELRTLHIRATEGSVLPDKFLGASTPGPQLRVIPCVIHLDGTALPTLPPPLSSSKKLVSLRLENIPPEGYFTPVIGLSSATQLELLEIGFHSCVFTPLLQRRDDAPHLPPCVVLPSLVEFQFTSDSKYLEDFASRVDAPIVEPIGVTFTCSYVLDTYEICNFFGRGEETRSSPHRTRIHPPFLPFSIFLRVVSVAAPRPQSATRVTRIEIEGFPEPSRWRRELNPTNWLPLLRAFTGVKRLHVVGTLVSSVVSALAQVTGETIQEIMPALRDLHLQGGPGTSASTSASVESFITARKLYGVPISDLLSRSPSMSDTMVFILSSFVEDGAICLLKLHAAQQFAWDE